jgi:hypothetical protein
MDQARAPQELGAGGRERLRRAGRPAVAAEVAQRAERPAVAAQVAQRAERPAVAAQVAERAGTHRSLCAGA